MAQNIVQSATALPQAPVDDRRRRMRNYTIAMSIRLVCLILVFLVPDWWKIVFGVSAVVLPYIAVVLANASSSLGSIAVRPGVVQPAIEQRHPQE